MYLNTLYAKKGQQQYRSHESAKLGVIWSCFVNQYVIETTKVHFGHMPDLKSKFLIPFALKVA